MDMFVSDINCQKYYYFIFTEIYSEKMCFIKKILL